MQYFINFIRTPLPGKGPEVLAAVKASLDATGRPGNLTVPISVPNPTQNGAAFVSLIGGFQNLDEVDAMMDASFNDDNVQNRLAAIDALCHRSSYVLSENLSGPIGIAQMAGDTAQAGFLPFMYLMALLSISLGVLNLLPIPVLDGGQLTLLGLEAIRGKPLEERAENIIYTGGALIVGALIIFAVFNDVARFF